MKKLLFITAMLFATVIAFAQFPTYDSTKKPNFIFANGYMYKIVGAQDGGVVLLPRNPPTKLAWADSGGLAYKNGVPVFWDGIQWNNIGTGIGGGTVATSYIIADNDYIELQPYGVTGDTMFLTFSQPAKDTLRTAFKKVDSLHIYAGELYYFNNGDSTKVEGISGGGWDQNGNTGTDPFANFIGTIDNKGLKFKVNNQQAGYIDLINTNTSFGVGSLVSNTTGVNNTAFGNGALNGNTSGQGNVGFGLTAGVQITTGQYNIAIGTFSMSTNTTGSNNIGIGAEALKFNVTGATNIAIGNNALRNNTVSSNLAIGLEAARNTTTGNQNVSVGESSLYNNTTGGDNTAVGFNSLNSTFANSGNTSVGSYSLNNIFTSSFNTALGNYAFYTSDSLKGPYNTALGYAAGLNIGKNTRHSIALGATATATSYQLGIADSIRFLKAIGLSRGGTTLGYVLKDTSGNGDLVLKPETGGGGGGVASIDAAAEGNAATFSGGPVTTSGTLTLNWLGASNEYIQGDGYLQAMPPSLYNNDFTITGTRIITGPDLTFKDGDGKAGISFNNSGHTTTIGSTDLSTDFIKIDGDNGNILVNTDTFFAPLSTMTAASFIGDGGSLTGIDAGNLTGTTLNSGIINSNLTSVGILTSGVWNATEVDTSHSKSVSNINVSGPLTKIIQGKGFLLKPDTTTGATNLATQGYVSRTYAPVNNATLTGTTNASTLLISTGLAVGTGSPASSAILDLTSTSKGFLKPRVTTAQRNAISSVVDGLEVYDTDEHANYYYNSDWGWESDALSYKKKFGYEYLNDFYSIVFSDGFFTAGGNTFPVAGSGTAARPGILTLGTSTNATGRSTLFQTNSLQGGFYLGSGKILFEAAVKIPTLSSSAETFAVNIGLCREATSISSSNGVFFSYDSAGIGTGSTAIGRWQVATTAGGTRSFTTTSVQVVAGQFYTLKAVINADATQVDFYIDGVLVKTETTNIPTVNPLGNIVNLIKSNGTTARTVDVDYYYFKQKFTTAR